MTFTCPPPSLQRECLDPLTPGSAKVCHDRVVPFDPRNPGLLFRSIQMFRHLNLLRGSQRSRGSREHHTYREEIHWVRTKKNEGMMDIRPNLKINLKGQQCISKTKHCKKTNGDTKIKTLDPVLSTRHSTNKNGTYSILKGVSRSSSMPK